MSHPDITANGLLYEWDEETETYWGWHEETQLYYSYEDESMNQMLQKEQQDKEAAAATATTTTTTTTTADDDDDDDSAPELYYCDVSGNYVYKGKILYADEETGSYYTDVPEEPVPTKIKDRVDSGDMPTWSPGSAASGSKATEVGIEDADTSAGGSPICNSAAADDMADTETDATEIETEGVDGEGVEGEDVEGEGVEGEGVEGEDAEASALAEAQATELAAVQAELAEAKALLAAAQAGTPTAKEEGVPITDIKPVEPLRDNPVMPRATGNCLLTFSTQDHALFETGCTALCDGFTSGAGNILLDHFRESRWGDYLVGRCRRSFQQLISGQTELKSITHRLDELSSVVNHLNECQLIKIRNHNQHSKWYNSPLPALRNFAQRVESHLPLFILARCLMRGIDFEKSRDIVYVPKYGPKDTKEPIVEQTQNIIKEFSSQHIMNCGRMVILIQGAVTSHAKDYADKCYALPKPLGEDASKSLLYYLPKTQSVSAELPAGEKIYKLALGNSRGGDLYEWKVTSS